MGTENYYMVIQSTEFSLVDAGHMQGSKMYIAQIEINKLIKQVYNM